MTDEQKELLKNMGVSEELLEYYYFSADNHLFVPVFENGGLIKTGEQIFNDLNNIDSIKQDKINELNKAMSDYIISNFYSSCLGTSKRFDCEDTDQIYIQGLVMKSQMILEGKQLSDTTTNWKESGVDVCYHFEPIQCIQLGVDLSIHLTQAKEKKEKLVVYVKSLTDKNTIESVTWDTVIPS